MARSKKQRQAWWRGLSADEQAQHIERWTHEKREKRMQEYGLAPAPTARLPFSATINGRQAVVYRDRIEYP